MKEGLHGQFTQIFELCEYILDNSQDSNLLSITLKTLLRFLLWIPIGYIFETKLIETLAVRFFPAQIFQNDTLRCLSEIGSIKLVDQPQAYNAKFVSMFQAVIGQVTTLITPETNVNQVYASGNGQAQTFIRYLTIFLTSCLNQHLELLENGDPQTSGALYQAVVLLLQISEVSDRIIFKICLEYWSSLVTELFQTKQRLGGITGGLNIGQLASQQAPQRLQKYAAVLSQLRVVLIDQMPKPEEVIIVEDENGQAVRVSLRDSDSITLYYNMRDCLVWLTHLDAMDTNRIMVDKLTREGEKLLSLNNGQESRWSSHSLNTLCWAIGSISGIIYILI